MKTRLAKTFLAWLLPLLCAGCGLSIYEDWQTSGGKAITGAGAVAGKDYINGLLPSADSRKYFTKLAAVSDQPIETVSRFDDTPGKSGVRFVKNGGILIPPGVTISFTNKGYCMDPHLPAPKAGEEYQLVPMAQLIPDDLQGTYKKLVQKVSAGDENVKRNMQHLVWALRTAGTDAAYANNLTAEQKRILNRCSEYTGQFEEFNANAKTNSKILKELLTVADSYLNIKIGGVTYKASDLLDPDIGNKKINEHLNQLIDMSKILPVERSGFNYGELQKGIYTDIRGSGILEYTAKIANSTNKEFIFYPTDYAGQVGSGTKSQGLTFFATANTSQRQRVTGGDISQINVIGIFPPTGEDNRYDHGNEQVSGKNKISNISDLIARFTSKEEQYGEIYYQNGQWYVSNLTTAGESGGTVYGSHEKGVKAGIHSHSNDQIKCFSPADISKAIRQNYMEMVVDRDQGKVFGMTPERAVDSYNRMRSEYNKKTGEKLPNIHELREMNVQDLQTTITRIDECFENISKDEARKLLVPFDYEITGFD